MSQSELTLERLIDASPERVWQAWTDPAKVQQWWGPRGVTNPTCVWEPRPGGKINIVMLAGKELGPLAGQEWPMTGEFKEVDARRKLVFASQAVMDGKPVLENLCTVTFEEQDGKTKLTVNIVVTKTMPGSEGPLAGMEIGWNQTLDKLVENVT